MQYLAPDMQRVHSQYQRLHQPRLRILIQELCMMRRYLRELRVLAQYCLQYSLLMYMSFQLHPVFHFLHFEPIEGLDCRSVEHPQDILMQMR